ncbi:MAG: hypothetical protein ACTHKU_17325 [Verrucomicrobiota bacterium]
MPTSFSNLLRQKGRVLLNGRELSDDLAQPMNGHAGEDQKYHEEDQ